MSPGPSSAADPARAAALARARAARVVMVVGATDTGKTSLVTQLADALLRDGRSVAVVDADLGQSEIGPPTTVGLGVLRALPARLRDAEVRGLAFVGATSPVGHLRATAAATGRLTDRARRLGVDHVLVDTSGLVQGAIGQALKRDKIARVGPDLVLCLERAGECAHILQALDVGAPTVVRLAAEPDARRRTASERQARREAAFATYFATARPVELDLGRVVPGDGGAAGDASPVLPDALVGLDGDGGETLGLGVVLAVDRHRGVLLVETPVPSEDVAAVRPSVVRLRLSDRSEAGLPPVCTEVSA